MGDFVTVDMMGATSVPGVFAAGNVVDPGAQVIMARSGRGEGPARESNMMLTNDDLEVALELRS